ncbi:MAG: hypothetical protein NBV67_18720 [Tagaea sp.]|nr:hypothetical protein [Tagaea sp.]
MNRAWMALAGLVAVGAVAVVHDLRDHAAGNMSAAECADLHAQLAANEAKDPVSVKFARDMFRLGGTCAPRDVEGAIRDIEAALRADLHESAILLYADGLLNLGQGKRASTWIRPAVAIALTSKGELAGPYGEADVYAPWLLRAIDRTKANLDSGNAGRITAELAAYFARPPRAPFAERRLARIGLTRLARVDPQESLYWAGRFEEWNANLPSGTPPTLINYSSAVECGDRRAMRRLGALHLEGNADEYRGRKAYFGLVLLADPTVEERALLSALEPRFGKTPVDMSDPLNRQSWKDIHAMTCASALRFIANQNR